MLCPHARDGRMVYRFHCPQCGDHAGSELHHSENIVYLFPDFCGFSDLLPHLPVHHAGLSERDLRACVYGQAHGSTEFYEVQAGWRRDASSPGQAPVRTPIHQHAQLQDIQRRDGVFGRGRAAESLCAHIGARSAPPGACRAHVGRCVSGAVPLQGERGAGDVLRGIFPCAQWFHRVTGAKLPVGVAFRHLLRGRQRCLGHQFAVGSRQHGLKDDQGEGRGPVEILRPHHA